ncbi:hypothetical protein L9F63_006112, partial [Diploptera punctata]
LSIFSSDVLHYSILWLCVSDCTPVICSRPPKQLKSVRCGRLGLVIQLMLYRDAAIPDSKMKIQNNILLLAQVKSARGKYRESCNHVTGSIIFCNFQFHDICLFIAYTYLSEILQGSYSNTM